MKKIAIIIPAFNEKENLHLLIEKILLNVPHCNIFIIDDTKDQSQLPNIKSTHNIDYFLRYKKKGRGSAVLEGIKRALNNDRYDLFVEMDADFSHDPNELNNNINLFIEKNYDLLISSRYLKESIIINWPITRKVFSYLSNFLAKQLLRINVSDYTNGYRIYSNGSAKIITEKCGHIGDEFIVLSEILLALKINNLKIGETKSTFVNRTRGESSVDLRLVLKSLLGLLKLFKIKLLNKKKYILNED